MSATLTADPTVTCDECGKKYTIPSARIEEWLKSHQDFPVELAIQAMLSLANWVVTDEHENDVQVCADCVVRLAPERARSECPDWCVIDHDQETFTGNEWAFEHAYEGGIVYTYRPVEELAVHLPKLDVGCAADDYEGRAEVAKDLRELAADLVKSAELLEARS